MPDAKSMAKKKTANFFKNHNLEHEQLSVPNDRHIFFFKTYNMST